MRGSAKFGSFMTGICYRIISYSRGPALTFRLFTDHLHHARASEWSRYVGALDLLYYYYYYCYYSHHYYH